LLQAKEAGRNRVVQLGTGMPDTPAKERRGLLRRWMQPKPSNYLVDETLITAVPLEITMEKLRGFISDHHAEIGSTSNDKLRLFITKDAGKSRRASDRPARFILSLTFFEKDNETHHPLDSNRTIIRVSIQLANTRDRRQDNINERARLLFASLQAYFMAQRCDGPVETEHDESNPTLFRRLIELLQPR
jgi:hypothetical protein